MDNNKKEYRIFTQLTQLLRGNVEQEDFLFLFLSFILIKSHAFNSLLEIRNFLTHSSKDNRKYENLRNELSAILKEAVNTREFYADSVSENSDNIALNQNILEKFTNLLNRISINQLFHLVQSFLDDSATDDEIPEVILYIRNYLSENSANFNRGYYGGGNKFGELIQRIVKIKDSQTIYDPAAGRGISASFLEMKKSNTLILQDINHDNLLLAKLFWFFQPTEPDFIVEDALLNPFPQKNSVDLVVSELPFGRGKKYKINEVGFDLWFNTSDFSSLFILQALHVLNNEGKAYLLVANNFLYAGGSQAGLRKSLVKNDIIESVISLPSNYLSGLEVHSSLLVLNLKKPLNRKNIIHFVDINIAEKEDIKLEEIARVISNLGSAKYAKSVTLKEVFATNFDILPSLFVDKIIISYNAQERLVKLKEVSKNVGRKAVTNTNLPYVQIKHLSDENSLIDLDLLNVEPNLKKKGKLIESPVLLVAKIGEKLKPTFYSGEGKGIIVDNNVFVIDVNQELIDIEYLVYELRKDYCKKQLQKKQTGTVIPSWSQKSILSVKIKMPKRINQEESLLTQKEAVNEIKENILREKQSEYKALEEKFQLETQEKSLEILGNFRHDFGNRMERLSSNIKVLKAVIANKGFYDSLIFEDEDVTIGDKLEQLEKAIVDSVNEAKAMYYEVVQEKETFVFEEKIIFDYLLKNIRTFKGAENYSVGFDMTNEFVEWKNKSDGPPKVKIAPQKFRKLLENLVSNAEKHAFIDSEKSNYKITFELGIGRLKGAEAFCLSYKDNGEGFPVDTNYKYLTERGKKAGNNAGSGIGGNQMQSIINKHEGQFEIVQIRPEEDVTSPYSVIYNIYLPIIL